MATLGKAGGIVTGNAIITPQQLRDTEPKISIGRANALAPILSQVCIKYGITTPLRLSAFLATIMEESGGFTRKEEKLYYTTAQRIVDVWPTRFTLELAKAYIKNPERLANYVYAGRLGNGNRDSGDGYKFRGFGYVQITGKAMHMDYLKYAGITEQQMRSNEFFAVDSAAWYFAIYNKQVMAAADAGDFRRVTRLVNGGYTNMSIRQIYYDRALKIFT